MARILTAKQFQSCQPGTVFAYGPRWAFGSLLILDEIIIGNGYWGFWACNPMWVDGDGTTEFSDLETMIETGQSRPGNQSSSKYMSYDGDEMEAFLVLEASDWARINAQVSFGGPVISDAP